MQAHATNDVIQKTPLRHSTSDDGAKVLPCVNRRLYVECRQDNVNNGPSF